MALPIKKEISVTHTVKFAVPAGIYDPLKFEIDARNKRMNDDADVEFYGPSAYQMVTEELRRERLEHEKKQKEPKSKGDKPELHAVQQSA